MLKPSLNLKQYKLKKLFSLMKEYGCIEDFGLGIDFDSIGVVIGDIKGKDISMISTNEVYLEDCTTLPITALTNKHINEIINMILNKN